MLTPNEEKEFRRWLKRIGRNMKKYRSETKTSQGSMSEKLGITVKQYQRLEYGDYPISSRNLFRIAKRMGVPVKRLVQ